MDEHCLHPAPSPGTWACCRCKEKTSGLPGDTRTQLLQMPCLARVGRWQRHFTEGWMF